MATKKTTKKTATKKATVKKAPAKKAAASKKKADTLGKSRRIRAAAKKAQEPEAAQVEQQPEAVKDVPKEVAEAAAIPQAEENKIQFIMPERKHQSAKVETKAQPKAVEKPAPVETAAPVAAPVIASVQAAAPVKRNRKELPYIRKGDPRWVDKIRAGMVFGTDNGSCKVESEAESIRGMKMWNCRCNACGNTFVKRDPHLKQAGKVHAVTCGCLRPRGYTEDRQITLQDGSQVWLSAYLQKVNPDMDITTMKVNAHRRERYLKEQGRHKEAEKYNWDSLGSEQLAELIMLKKYRSATASTPRVAIKKAPEKQVHVDFFGQLDKHTQAELDKFLRARIQPKQLIAANALGIPPEAILQRYDQLKAEIKAR